MTPVRNAGTTGTVWGHEHRAATPELAHEVINVLIG